MNTKPDRDIMVVDLPTQVAPMPINQPPVVQQSETGAILSMIERASRDPSVDLEKFERLMAMRERMEHRAAQIAFSAAIAGAKAEIEPITRNATGHNSKKYADFSAIARVVDPVLSRHGLSYRFRSNQTDRITVTCILSHSEGHSEETSLSGQADKTGSKNDIQAIGSTLTYLQRYSLVLSLGLASSADDDGKTADASGLISEQQLSDLQTGLAETNSNMEIFLRVFKIEALPDLPASKFKQAIEMIDKKRVRPHD